MRHSETNTASVQKSSKKVYDSVLKGVESILDYAIFFLDEAGYITTWNKGAERISGYKAAEAIGKHFSILYPKDSGPLSKSEQGFSQDRIDEEGWRIRKDGTLFWANIVINTTYDDNTNNVLGFTVIIRDLTERKQAELFLFHSEERFRLLVSSVKDYAIFMLDPEGYVTTWNEGAKRFKGYEAEEIIGKHFSVFYPEEAIARNHPAHELEVAIEQGRFEEEGWRIRKDGSLFWANVVITAVFNSENNLLGFAKVTRDLTERKQMIDELTHSKETAEAINKELESFSYSISHDLRAPLRSIDGYSSLLMEEKAEQLDAEALEWLQRIGHNACQMGKLIDDLLNLSRLTRMELLKQPVNLSEKVQEILQVLKEESPKRNVQIEIQRDLFVDADAVLLTAALRNLLDNAWKFTALMPHSEIEFGKKDDAFFIRDNGVGFSMVYADKLFQAFQRLHSDVEFPGTGIGLVTVKRIINRHGGDIWVESVENRGTVFFFTL